MSPRITAAELAAARRRQAQPKREPGELVACFIDRPLTNPMNAKGYGGHWTKHMRWARTWKDAAWSALYETSRKKRDQIAWPEATVPKCVSFIAHVSREWDDDNLRTAMKPARDALREAGVIDDDKPSAGHEFLYSQIVDRTRAGKRGLEIRVRLRTSVDDVVKELRT